MASSTRLVITSNGTAADFKSECNLSMGGLDAANNFSAYIAGLAGGSHIGASLSFHVGNTAASGTVTFSSTGPTAAQTMTVAGVTLTAVASGAVNNQFNINATPATQATNFAAAVNASTNLTGVVIATVVGAVVTITGYTPGKMSNGLVMANVNLANTVVVNFSGGVDGTATLVNLR